MNTVIHTQFLRTKCNDIFQRFGIGTTANYHWFVLRVAGHIHISLVQGIYQRGFSWEEQRITDFPHLNTAIFIFQITFYTIQNIILFESYRYTDVDGAGDHAILCFYDSIAEGQLTKLIGNFKTNTGAVTGCSNVLIIKFNKIVFEACLCKTFHGNTCGVDTKSWSAGMSRYTFCINGDLIFGFCNFIFLQFCFGKHLLQLLLKTSLCRNHSGTVIAYCIRNKATIHGDNSGIFGICHHGHIAFFTMNTWEICIRCKTAG